MRSHRHILREIAQRNLDPRIPYVVGENNLLVEKDKKLDNENSEELKDQDPMEENLNTQVEEAEAKEEKPKKRVPPPRKKKEVVTE